MTSDHLPEAPQTAAAMEAALAAAVVRHMPDLARAGLEKITGLRRLSGGNSKQTWSFDAVTAQGVAVPLILRRAPPQRPGGPPSGSAGMTLEQEAVVVGRARRAAVPAPRVHFVLTPDDALGSGFVMAHIAGESIARKILRDREFDAIRPHLARQCGGILARIHGLDAAALDGCGLPVSPPAAELERYRSIYRAFNRPRAVLELALRWLEDHLPPPSAPVLVHGDFRNGNLMIDAGGVRAVLDWELAHLGDPMADLGWICVNSWRFGRSDMPVGGFGLREDMHGAYEEAGGAPVDPERARFWEIMGTLRWGVMCMMIGATAQQGEEISVERAAVGRRVSETELDLLNLLAPE